MVSAFSLVVGVFLKGSVVGRFRFWGVVLVVFFFLAMEVGLGGVFYWFLGWL